MKSAVFDIETTDLAGVGAGVLLAACIRPLSTKRTRVYRLDSYKYEPDNLFGVFEREEKDLLTDILAELEKYDLLIGHNIEGFDLGFLRTRASVLGIPFRLEPFTYDTMKGFRRSKFRTRLNGFGKPSAALAMIADFLGIDQEKTSIYPVEWWAALWGTELKRIEAMNNIVDHCKKDVRMNHRVYEMILPHDKKGSIRRWM